MEEAGESTGGMKCSEDQQHAADGTRSDQGECAICLQQYNLPVEIPCGHCFCFLCIKGVCARNSRCPICRRDVPVDYFQEPKVIPIQPAILNESKTTKLDVDDTSEASSQIPNTSQTSDGDNGLLDSNNVSSPPSIRWYYEGRNGWWQYDDRTSAFLEDVYTKNPDTSTVETMISGYVYVIDIHRMIQYRKDEPSRRRCVLRQIADENSDVQTLVKGVAGLKLPVSCMNTL